jgi:transposase-like protein
VEWWPQPFLRVCRQCERLAAVFILAKALCADKKMPVMDICRTLNVSRPTLYRWLALN